MTNSRLPFCTPSKKCGNKTWNKLKRWGIVALVQCSKYLSPTRIWVSTHSKEVKPHFGTKNNTRQEGMSIVSKIHRKLPQNSIDFSTLSGLCNSPDYINTIQRRLKYDTIPQCVIASQSTLLFPNHDKSNV